MAVDPTKPYKLDLDQFIATAVSATPAELHPYFQSFQTLYNRKYVTEYKLKDCQGSQDLFPDPRLVSIDARPPAPLSIAPIIQAMAPTHSQALRVLRPPPLQAVPR